MAEVWPYRVVGDANVFVSAVRPSDRTKARKNGFDRSPTQEFIDRWLEDEFRLLCTLAIWYEIVEKLEQLGTPRQQLERLGPLLRELSEEVVVVTQEAWCEDPDDDKYLRAAIDGRATHLVSYDNQLLRPQWKFSFRRMRVLSFLRELRERLRAQAGRSEEVAGKVT